MSTKEDERRVLEASGWEPEERDGETVWRRPGSMFLYPPDVALRLYAEEEAGAA